MRDSLPIVTSATSLTRTGTPPRVATGIAAISRHVFDAPAGAHDIAFAIVLDILAPRLTLLASMARTMSPKESQSAINFDGIGLHLVLLDVSADRVDAGHTRNALELRPNDPVLHRSQIRGTLKVVGQLLPLRSEIAAVALPPGLPFSRA